MNSRTITMSLSVGAITTGVSADGVSWNPDVADDMTRRLEHLLANTLGQLAQHDVLALAMTDQSSLTLEDVLDELALEEEDEEVEEGTENGDA